jgi:hypothetical protein
MLLHQLYEPHQLVCILCNAIFCGLQSVTGLREAVQLKVGSKFQCNVLTLRKDKYKWQTAAINITARAYSWDGNNVPSELNVFEFTGVGTTSRTLRALSNDGKE